MAFSFPSHWQTDEGLLPNQFKTNPIEHAYDSATDVFDSGLAPIREWLTARTAADFMPGNNFLTPEQWKHSQYFDPNVDINSLTSGNGLIGINTARQVSWMQNQLKRRNFLVASNAGGILNDTTGLAGQVVGFVADPFNDLATDIGGEFLGPLAGKAADYLSESALASKLAENTATGTAAMVPTAVNQFGLHPNQPFEHNLGVALGDLTYGAAFGTLPAIAKGLGVINHNFDGLAKVQSLKAGIQSRWPRLDSLVKWASNRHPTDDIIPDTAQAQESVQAPDIDTGAGRSDVEQAQPEPEHPVSSAQLKAAPDVLDHPFVKEALAKAKVVKDLGDSLNNADGDAPALSKRYVQARSDLDLAISKASIHNLQLPEHVFNLSTLTPKPDAILPEGERSNISSQATPNLTMSDLEDNFATNNNPKNSMYYDQNAKAFADNQDALPKGISTESLNSDYEALSKDNSEALAPIQNELNVHEKVAQHLKSLKSCLLGKA